MGYTYSATAERFGAIARREGGRDVEVELHIGTVTIRKDGEDLLEFDISDAEELSEALAE